MFEHYSTEPIFNVKAVVHQTGVSAATLRAWERRYGVPNPPRTESGYRLYSARDIAIIRWLKAQVDSGLSISQAVQLLRAQQAASAPSEPAAPAPDLPRAFQRLHEAILAGARMFDEERIDQALNEAFSLFAVEDVCEGLVQPVLHTVGTLWASGALDVSMEHFVTNIIRRRLMALINAAPAPVREARIIAACAPQEYHEVGLLLLTLLLRRRGYGVLYLGQDTPGARLADAVAQTHAEIVLLSASTLVSAANLLDTVELLRAQPSGYRLRIAFGGRVFSRVPALQSRVPAAYLAERARDAVAQIESLLAAPPTWTGASPQTDGHHNGSDLLAHLHAQRAQVVGRFVQAAALSAALSHLATAQLQAVAEELNAVVLAALRFRLPEALRDLDVVRWREDSILHTLPLPLVADLLAESWRAVIPTSAFELLAPYFVALRAAVQPHTSVRQS